MCYTSASTIKANVVELLKIKDACTKLKTNQEAVVSTSKESKRQKRGKSSEVVTCSVYITEVETLNTVKFIQIIVENLKLWIQVLQSSSLIGKGDTIVSQSTTIITQSVLTCSTSEITSINNNIAILTAVIVKVTTLVTQYQKVKWKIKRQ